MSGKTNLRKEQRERQYAIDHPGMFNDSIHRSIFVFQPKQNESVGGKVSEKYRRELAKPLSKSRR